MEAVLNSIEGPIGLITLNRPEVMNALDRTLGEGLARALETCNGNPEVRVIVLTGAGGGFCSGGDIKAAWQYISSGGDAPQYFGEVLLSLNRIILDFRRTPKPVIAAINGAAGGAGISLLAACDYRIAVESARFKQAYTSIGLVPDGGWTAFVPRLIGTGRAMELLYLDPMLSAQEAKTIGLIHEVVPDGKLMERARALAEQLAQGAASAYAGSKKLINAAQFADLEEQLERERQGIIAQARAKDFVERAKRFAMMGPAKSAKEGT